MSHQNWDNPTNKNLKVSKSQKKQTNAHQCIHCSKNYKMKSALNDHIEQVHKCPACSMIFSSVVKSCTKTCPDASGNLILLSAVASVARRYTSWALFVEPSNCTIFC